MRNINPIIGSCLLTIALCATRATADPTGLPAHSDAWVAGSNFEVYAPTAAATPRAKQVEVVEFFSYGCEVCFEFEPSLNHWLQGKPTYIAFARVPVTWHPAQRAYAKLFYTLASLHRSDLDGTVFTTVHDNPAALFDSDEQRTLQLQTAFAARHGISQLSFTTARSSQPVERQMAEAERLGRLFRIKSTPTMVVNGRYGSDLLRVRPPDLPAGTLVDQILLTNMVTLLANSEAHRLDLIGDR